MQGDGYDRARAIIEPFRLNFPRITVGIAVFSAEAVKDFHADRDVQRRVQDAVLEVARNTLPAGNVEIQTIGGNVLLVFDGRGFHDLHVLAERRADLNLLKTMAMYAGSELPLPARDVFWTTIDEPVVDDEWQCPMDLRWFIKITDDDRFSRELQGDFPSLVQVRVCDDTLGASWTLLNELLRPANVSRPPEPKDDEEREIIELIRSVGHRLTTAKLLSEFGHRGSIKAESTVKLKLARLVDVGLLTNRQDRRLHKGYGLPEWD